MGSDVLIGHEGPTSIYLRDSNRTAHVAILGKSRFGKTTLLEHLVLNDMRDGTGAIVIDAHGDLTRRLVALAPFKNPDRPDDPRTRVILVEPNTEQPFGLNLYECPPGAKTELVEKTVGQVLEIFHKLMGAEGTGLRPVIDPGFRNTARVLIANQLTMAELPLLYTDQAFRHHALRRITNQHVHQYWQNYESAPYQRRQEKSDPILNKVGRFLEDDLIRLMVSQDKTTIPFKSVMDHGGILLLNLAGLDREAASFLGMVFLSVLSNLIHQRDEVPKSRRRRVHLYLDEYGRFSTSTTQRLLEEGGKYEIGITIAHQNLSQTPDKEAISVESLITFQLSADDAHEVAGSFDCTPVRTKRIARQRTEPQYREWDEDVWDSDVARRYYEDVKSKLKAVQSRYWKLERENVVASGMLREIEPLSRKHRFDSSDGTVSGVYILHDLPFALGSPEIDMNQLSQILHACTEKYGHWPEGDELSEAHQWLDTALVRCEEIYRDRDLLPKLREEIRRLESKITALHEKHTSLEPRKEHIGDIPVTAGYATVYDYIDELDQTHADRQAEIANMLTQLPRYVAYCKVLGADGKPHEYQIKTPPPASLPTYKDYQRQTETAERRREREERERSWRLRGVDWIDVEILDDTWWSPDAPESLRRREIEFAKRTKEFKKDHRDFQQKYIIGPHARLGTARSDSRKQFGVPVAQVSEQIKRRQVGKPPPEPRQTSPPATPDDDPEVKAPEEEPPDDPPIGRRSPKKPPGK